MFLLVAGRAQSRGRADEPIRTQRDHSRPSDQPVGTRRSKRRSEKESDSSNKYPPIIVGPLTTNQDLTDIKGEKIYNLPLMIQQPFLREKKEPIKVDISVKLIPKPRKKDKKKREAQVEEIVIQAEEEKGVKNTISMEVVDGNIQVLKETVEMVDSDKVRDESNKQQAKEALSETSKTELEETQATVEQDVVNEEDQNVNEPLDSKEEVPGETTPLRTESENNTIEKEDDTRLEGDENNQADQKNQEQDNDESQKAKDENTEES